MNKIGIILTVLLTLSCFGHLDAQNLNSIQRGQRGYSPPPIDREQGAIAIENSIQQVDGKMEVYAVEFSLDAFEKAVMKNYLVDYETKNMSIRENESITYDIKQQSLLKLNDELSAKLATMLTEQEVNRFNELHFSPENKKKKRKKKKSKS